MIEPEISEVFLHPNDTQFAIFFAKSLFTPCFYRELEACESKFEMA